MVLKRSSSIRYCLAIGLFAPLIMDAQGDRGSLTQDFPNMSAKERSRVAAKEAEEAGKDATYQEVMRAAELAFQEGRYEEAIGRYEEARAMRPYNVYPKVKIEDLRVLIARRAAKPDTATVAKEEPAVPPQVTRLPMPASATVTPLATQPPPTTPPMDPVTEIPTIVHETPPPPPPVQRSAGEPADGIIEQRYREGQAFVIERAVTVNGRLVKYKRVYHPYGRTFYFEDGLSVDERVWNARFPDK